MVAQSLYRSRGIQAFCMLQKRSETTSESLVPASWLIGRMLMSIYRHKACSRELQHLAHYPTRANFTLKPSRPGFGPALKRLGRTKLARCHVGCKLHSRGC